LGLEGRPSEGICLTARAERCNPFFREAWTVPEKDPNWEEGSISILWNEGEEKEGGVFHTTTTKKTEWSTGREVRVPVSKKWVGFFRRGRTITRREIQ